MIPLNFLLFVQIILFLFITPGSPRVLIVYYSMSYGLKKTVWTALGDISANTLQLFLVVAGLGLLVKNNPFMLLVLKWVGFIYLLYLAYDLYQSKLKEINATNQKEKNILSFFKDGFLVAGLSPKAWVFFGVIFIQFVDYSLSYSIFFLQLFILWFSYIALDFVTLMIYGFTADKISVWLKSNPKKINIISSIALVIIAFISVFVKV